MNRLRFPKPEGAPMGAVGCSPVTHQEEAVASGSAQCLTNSVTSCPVSSAGCLCCADAHPAQSHWILPAPKSHRDLASALQQGEEVGRVGGTAAGLCAQWGQPIAMGCNWQLAATGAQGLQGPAGLGLRTQQPNCWGTWQLCTPSPVPWAPHLYVNPILTLLCILFSLCTLIKGCPEMLSASCQHFGAHKSGQGTVRNLPGHF